MPFGLSRRQFFVLSGLSALGAGGYGLTRALARVRGAAARMKDV
jgi:hypothetical protein